MRTKRPLRGTIVELVTRLQLQINAEKHPRTAEALSELQQAVKAELTNKAGGKKVQGHRALQNKVYYLQKKVDALESEVKKYKEQNNSSVDGRLTSEWILRVFLASPHASGRALADSFRLVAGEEEGIVSRWSIHKIKCAWVEMYISMVMKMASQTVQGHFRSQWRDKQQFLALTLVHVQDEADIRLRSGDVRDGPTLPKRGRASKVQIHVVKLAVGHHVLEIPTELQALGDKSTGTLATSLEGILREVVGQVLPVRYNTGHGPEIWVLHLLIGDAIPTNDSASRVVWASVKGKPLGTRVRYFLLVTKCMTHQTALSAKSAVMGPAASTASSGRDDDDVADVTGVASRLFKYLLNDYYEEFCTNARNWVITNLKVVEDAEADRTHLSRGQDVQKLRELYTEHVVPDEMLALWNVSASSLTHRLPPGARATDSRSALEDRFTAFIVKRLLMPDEHPTLTRFFTFRGVIDKMLTMDIIGLPEGLLTLQKIKPKEENQKRLKKVRSFFAKPAAKQALRRASLVLQLTGGLEALTASETREGQFPKIVDLVNGAGHDIVKRRLRRLLGVMPNDELLKLAPATSNLLATAADLINRFNRLQRYPFILCRLCRKWFPHRYMQTILQFLNEEDDALDVGVSMQLRDLAFLAPGKNLNTALLWMSSTPVQEFIEQLCNHMLCHSLDAERKAAQVKHWESSKVVHIGTASMHNICCRFAKQREEKALAISAAAKRVRQLRYTNRSSNAWKLSRPAGITFQPGSENPKISPSSQQPNPNPIHIGSQKKEEGGRQRDRFERSSSFKSSGSSSCLSDPRSQQPGVKRKLDQSLEPADPHALAALVSETSRLLTEASDELTRLLSCCVVPVTRFQWASWLDENITEFRSRMATAHLDRRKLTRRSVASFFLYFLYFSSLFLFWQKQWGKKALQWPPKGGYRGRLRARADLPRGVPRLQPRRVGARLQKPWAVKLQGRLGWHAVRTLLRLVNLLEPFRGARKLQLLNYIVEGAPCGVFLFRLGRLSR